MKIDAVDAKRVAEEIVEDWRESIPGFPWGIVVELATHVVSERQDIILLRNTEAASILEQLKRPIPDNYSAGMIAGKANPLIVDVRGRLKK